MTDPRTVEQLRMWLQSSVAPEPDPRQSAVAILERIEGAPPARHTHTRWMGGAFSPYLRAAAGIAVVALAASLAFVLLGDARPPSDEPLPAVVGEPLDSEPSPDGAIPDGPPIHWQSDEVDLRAEGMTLRLGDEVYTGEGATFAIESHHDGPESWSISPSWHERGEDLGFRISFSAHEDRWWNSIQFQVADMVGPDGTRYSGVVPLGDYPSNEPGSEVLKLGRPWVTDLVRYGSLERPSCGGFGFETLDVSLELDGLHLDFDPQGAPSLGQFEAAVDDAPERIGFDDTDGAIKTIELVCPPEETTERQVGELTLIGVPVADGVLRLTGDGINDYDQPMNDAAVDDTGRIFVAMPTGLQELGSDAPRLDTSGKMKHLARIDFASDRTMIIRGGERKVDKNLVAIRGDDRWFSLPDYDLETPGGGAPRDLNDPVIAADGSLYVGVPGGLGRFDGDTWASVSRKLTSPLATAVYAGPFGPTKGLVVTEDGTIWVGIGHTLSEYRDGTWVEHEPLAGYIDELLGGLPDDERFEADLMDLGIGRDGTLWAVARISAKRTNRGGIALVRGDAAGWAVFPLEEVAPGSVPDAWNILVDDDGAVLLLLADRTRSAAPRPDGARLVRFDGETLTGLARLPSGLGFRLTDVGPDGTVWLIGGYPRERQFDRIHLVTQQTEAADT